MTGVVAKLDRWLDSAEEMKLGAAQLFRDARGELGGLTQQQMADALGVTIVWINRIENGKSRPSVELMERLQELLRSR